MTVYLDSMIVIYLVEGPDPFRIKARDRMAQLVAAGDRAAVSDLTRLECRVKPIRLGDASLLAEYDAFFAAPDLLGLALLDRSSSGPRRSVRGMASGSQTASTWPPRSSTAAGDS